MKKEDYFYLCDVIGNLAGMPVRIYKNDVPIYYKSLVNLPIDPIKPYIDDILKIDSHIGYYITPYFDYYGVVGGKQYKIVIGPSRQSAISERDIRELAFKCDINVDELADFICGMKSIVQMPLTSIIQMLCTMNFVINKEKLSLKDITIYDHEQEDIKAFLEATRAKQKFDLDISGDALSSRDVHNTISIEQTLTSIVRKGDSVALRKWVSNAPAVRGGTLAHDQLRQMKNTFIVTATLVSRSAISGGMDVEDALSLSDSYIQKCELLNSLDSISNLQYHMVSDYTERVEKIRNGASPSKLIVDVANYVRHHLSEPVSVERLARALYISRTRLSVKFKEQTGITLTDFFLKEKIDEAKRLLRYTDKPLSSISAYLGFSSQSHFSRTFRKYTDISPNEYRKKYE